MKYLLFGTGDYYERYTKWFDRDDIVALLDNSPKKQNTLIDGIKVLSPKEGIQLDFDVIVILSFYVKSMKAQLLELGVDEKCIYHFYDLHKLLVDRAVHRPIKYYGNAESMLQGKNGFCKRILLLSHDLTLGGPALALYHAAEILSEKGYEVIFSSMLDGPLRQQILDKNIPVIVDENLQIATMMDISWTSQFDLIVCNTISYYVFLSERNVKIPTIWWLHDSSFFYDGVDKEILKQIHTENLTVVSVGTVPRQAIQEFAPELSVGNLLYGVEDEKKKAYNTKKQSVCLRFTTIGYIEDRKGQDILVAAIKRLPQEVSEQCEFYLVGQNTSLMAQQIRDEIQDIPQVVITGVVGRDEISNILCETDMLLCPSREDPMPTVAAEAMMHSVPCILSDATGTAAYIHEGENGFVFMSEDVDELARKIQWCVENRSKIKGIGENARKLYEEYFSMKAFEIRLMEVINKALNK